MYYDSYYYGNPYGLNFSRRYPRVVAYNFGNRNKPSVKRLIADYPNIVADINSKVNERDPYTREDLAEYKRIKSDPDYKAYMAEKEKRLEPINDLELQLDKANSMLNQVNDMIAQGDSSKGTLDLKNRVISAYDEANNLQDALEKDLGEWSAPYFQKYDGPLAGISEKRRNLNQALDNAAAAYDQHIHSSDRSANRGARKGMVIGGLTGSGLGAGLGAYLASRNGVNGTRGRRAAWGALAGAGLGAIGGSLVGRAIGRKLGLKSVGDFDPLQHVY